MDWKERLKHEHEDLIERRDKLRGFIGTTEFLSLEPMDQEALRAQCSLMTVYVDILTRRRQRQIKRDFAADHEAHNA